MTRASRRRVIDLTHVRFAYRTDQMLQEERRARELVVEQGRRAYVAVGQALWDLHDRGGFDDERAFQEYVEQTWGSSVWRQFVPDRFLGIPVIDGQGHARQDREEE